MDITARNLEKHVRALTDDIGIRLAGSKEEYQAAEYIRDACLQYTPTVTIEEFPIKERCVTSEKLEILVNGEWREFPCSLFSSAPSTDGKPVEADLALFDTTTGYQRPDLSFLKGKAVIHLGCHIEDEESFRRLIHEAAPAFILFVDTRFMGTVQLADGLFPKYVKKYGAIPSVNVAYMDAWNWLRDKATRARLCVSGGTKDSKTSVVVCEIKGTAPDSGVIYAGGHHDTQAGTVGADDNAIGSAAVIELARLLSAKPHKRTYRLISFGAEEQLSVGSYSYVKAHWADIEKNGVFMCNFDSYGTRMGWYECVINGTDAMLKLTRDTFNAQGIYLKETTEPCPYTDQFPFAACKVPGIWLERKNCPGGQFYHHRADNTPDKLGFADAAKLVTSSATLLEKLGDMDDISALRGIPQEQQKLIDELFGAVYC